MFRRSFFQKLSTKIFFHYRFVGIFASVTPPKKSSETISSEPVPEFFPPRILLLSFLVEESFPRLRRNVIIHISRWYTTEIASNCILVGAVLSLRRNSIIYKSRWYTTEIVSQLHSVGATLSLRRNSIIHKSRWHATETASQLPFRQIYSANSKFVHTIL